MKKIFASVLGSALLSAFASATPTAQLSVTVPGGTIYLQCAASGESGSTGLSNSTRRVSYDNGKTFQTVNDIEATSASYNGSSGGITLTWNLWVSVRGTADYTPTGTVSYKFDEVQQCGSDGYCDVSGDSVLTTGTQELVSSSVYEPGLNFAPDVDDPDPVTSEVGNSITFAGSMYDGAN